LKRLPYGVQVALLAAIYFVAAKLSLLLAIPPGYATAVWPPAGIAVAATLVFGRAILPGVWIGAALVNLTVESSPLAAAFIASGNTLEALAAAALIRRHVGVPFRFERGEDVVRFAAFAALSAAIAATVALAPLSLKHGLSWSEIAGNWWTWWQGDASGIIIVAPLLLSWCVAGRMAWSIRKVTEGACFALLLLIVARMVFGGAAADGPPYALTFAILPFFAWAAFRFGQREVTTAIATVCGIAVWYTLERRGPFATAPLNESLLLLLSFISTVVISGLALSAALGERTRAMAELRRRTDEVEELVRKRTLELERANAALERDVAARERSESKLQESERRFRSLTELSSDWYWEQDENLRFTFLSGTVYEKSGYRATSVIGMTRWEVPDTTPLSDGWAGHRAALAARQAFRDFEYRRVGQDRTLRFISVSGEPLFDANGEFKGYRGIGRDITERKLAEDKVRESRENLAAAQRIAHLGSWELDLGDLSDPDKNVLRWSDETFRIFGYQPGEIEVSNENFFKAVHPDDRARVLEQVTLAIDRGTSYSVEHRIVRPDETERIVQELSGIVYDPVTDKPVKMVGTVQDITERKRAEEHLTYLAWFDSLTGLPNRHRLHDHLSQRLAQAGRTAGSIGCMIVKLDHFKDVNSIYGHQTGDKLLVEVAERLLRSARESDAVARLGGSEFALVLSNLTKPDDAGVVAQKVIDALTPRFNLGGRETYISANIGISTYPGDGDDPEELLKNADAAMQRAKEHGRNTFRFYLPRMNERTLKRLELDVSLRGALERDEFLLHYQPKVDLTSGVISGLEALLRWQHPERGRMAPADFVPILEETGLIAPVGEWVLRTVCEQIKAWQARGITVPPIAVNLSAQQFHRADFDAQVRALIAKSGVDCRLIQLEITESMLMRDPAEAAAMLGRLKRMGLTLSIDDFGTGYSSLAYLKRFPLDALKIDRTFVRDLTTDSDDGEIALAIISLAHNLKLKVVAEGVETEAQMNFLRSHACDEMQGYYFARPLSVEDCSRTLIEGRRMHFAKPRVASPSAGRVFPAMRVDATTAATEEVELDAGELEWLRRCNAHSCTAPPAVVAALDRAGFATPDDLGRLKVTDKGRAHLTSYDAPVKKRRRKSSY
jgi:diguanylate cyclase (GGDEF)-like protein/PAS domain S-box-containing protein